MFWAFGSCAPCNTKSRKVNKRLRITERSYFVSEAVEDLSADRPPEDEKAEDELQGHAPDHLTPLDPAWKEKNGFPAGTNLIKTIRELL